MIPYYKRIHIFSLVSYLVFFHCRWRWHSIKQLSFSSVLLDYFSTWLIMASKHSSKHHKISTGSNCLCNISRACAATILWNIGQINIYQALNILKVFPNPVSRNLLTLCMFFGEFWNCLPTTFELHQSYIYYYTAAKTKSIKDNKICDVRESNPGQLLGRQLCSPLYHQRLLNQTKG